MSEVELAVSFVNNAAYYDPDGGVTLLVKEPGKHFATYTYPADITKDSTGHYSMSLTVNSVGIWTYVWVSDDASKGHVESGDKIQVQPALSHVLKELPK
jgi:hypothetical protein